MMDHRGSDDEVRAINENKVVAAGKEREWVLERIALREEWADLAEILSSADCPTFVGALLSGTNLTVGLAMQRKREIERKLGGPSWAFDYIVAHNMRIFKEKTEVLKKLESEVK